MFRSCYHGLNKVVLIAILLCAFAFGSLGCATPNPSEKIKQGLNLNIRAESDGQRVKVFWSPDVLRLSPPPLLAVSHRTGEYSTSSKGELRAPGKMNVMILGENPPTLLSLQPGEYDIVLLYMDSTGKLKQLTDVVTINVK